MTCCPTVRSIKGLVLFDQGITVGPLYNCRNTLLHIQLADDCLDRYSQDRPFFVHIRLAVDHAKNYYSLCSVTL